MATETWYMYERDVPALGGKIQPETGANAAYCLPGEQRCTAPEYAVVRGGGAANARVRTRAEFIAR
ncbi:MAG: hypothetical protein WCA13_02965 [Terriglobales bacterium]